MKLLGFMDDDIPGWASEGRDILDKLRQTLSDVREQAMTTKDFSAVDAMKAALTDAGVEIRMSRNDIELLPAEGFDPHKLEALK